jgi:lipid-A-disaccharide synthase
MKRFFLVAGEPSGDLLGAALMRGLREELGGRVAFEGVGGVAMGAEGLTSIVPQDDLAVMGLVEVLPRLPRLLGHIARVRDACLAARPDALITIDSPSFGLRVMRGVRRAAPTIPTIHYVAPSVWAWRPNRARRMAGLVDHILALLPFEPPYFTAHGITCDFVGHPAATAPRPDRAALAAARETLGLGAAQPVLLALPGSRMGEVQRDMAPFGAVVDTVAAQYPGLAVLVPTLSGVADVVTEGARRWSVRPVVLDPRDAAMAALPRSSVFGLGTAALATSGTVTLELAAAGVPMVAVYRTAWLTAQIVRRIVTVDTANLVNLVSGSRPVPEFLQEYFTTAAAADALLPLLGDSPERARQLAAFETVMTALGREGPPPGLRAARSVLAALQRRQRGC